MSHQYFTYNYRSPYQRWRSKQPKWVGMFIELGLLPIACIIAFLLLAHMFQVIDDAPPPQVCIYTYQHGNYVCGELTSKAF